MLTTNVNLQMFTKNIMGGGSVNIGEIFWWPLEEPPGDSLYCDGRAVSREEYAKLYEVIGTQFGSGDGETTFNLPDMRGEFVRGYDPEKIRDPQGDIRGLGKHQDATSVLHLAVSGNRTDISVGSTTSSQSATNHDGVSLSTSGYTWWRGTAASGASTNKIKVRPTNINLLPCIRYKREELPWCSGRFQNRSIAAATGVILTPLHERGYDDMISGNVFIAQTTGLYVLSVGGAQSSMTGSGNIYTTLKKNSVSTPTAIVESSNLGTAVSDSTHIAGLSIVEYLDDGDYLALLCSCGSARGATNINANGSIFKFAFAKIG